MQISEIRKSQGRDGFEIRVFFGEHNSQIFWHKNRNDILVHEKRLWRLQNRLQSLIDEFQDMRRQLPGQESVIAEQIVCILFQDGKVDIKKTTQRFLMAAKSGDWDCFYSEYYSKLAWLGTAQKKEIEIKLGKYCFTKHYKITLQKLVEKRNLETLLFLRLMMETGIRARDVYQIDASCIDGKHVKIVSSKLRGGNYYQRPDGSFPKISNSTCHIAEVLDKNQGKWFTKPYEYYIQMIHRVWNHTYFSLYMLRKYRMACDNKREQAEYLKCWGSDIPIYTE